MASMKRRRSATRRFLPVVLLAALAAAACDLFDNDGRRDAGPAAAASIVMVASTDRPAPGEFFDVVFTILSARDVVSTPFKLRFDPDIIRFEETGSVVGPFLTSSGGNVVFIATLAGTGQDEVWVALSILGASAGVDGNGELCRLRFQVLPGTTAASASLVPFEAFVLGVGLIQQPVVFPSLTLTLP